MLVEFNGGTTGSFRKSSVCTGGMYHALLSFFRCLLGDYYLFNLAAPILDTEPELFRFLPTYSLEYSSRLVDSRLVRFW